MKAANVILASLMGHALAAPASAESNAPASGSPEDICLQASTRVFDQCFQTRQRDETLDSLRERCNKERDDAKKGCLDVEVQNGTVVDGNDARKKKAECAVPGNRAFAQCMKDKVLKKSGETREDCEKKRENASEACIKGEQVKPDQGEAIPNDPSKSESTGQTIDEYCQVMEATSNGLYDKQFCLDAFKSCGDPTSLNDAKAKDCANQIMTDKFLGKVPSSDPTIPDSKEEEQQSEAGTETIDQQPDTSTRTCQ
ncbi:hypothetical protein ACQRIT_002885 [Beauveria bassiana]